MKDRGLMLTDKTLIRELRYAVLHHTDIDQPHFDLLVETYPGSDLATWRSPVWPIQTPTQLQRLKDHRRIYLQYQGDLTDRRGHVQRIAEGACRVEIGANGAWKIEFPIRDKFELAPIHGDQWTATALK
jgi:hypothetical protein